MAHETANPKVRFMVILALASAVTLVLFDMMFKSYFTMMMEEEERAKVLTVPPTQLHNLRAAEQQRLTSTQLPIDRAMRELATRGREDPALKDIAKTDISPQPSNDMGALVGWSLMAKDAGPVPTTPEHAPSPAADAGTATATDAQATPATTTATHPGDAAAALPHAPAPEAGTH